MHYNNEIENVYEMKCRNEVYHIHMKLLSHSNTFNISDTFKTRDTYFYYFCLAKQKLIKIKYLFL